MRIERLDETTRKNLLEDLLKRSPNSYGTYEASVREILDEVKNRRDEAVFAYTEKFDGAALNADNIQVTEEEIQKAYSQVDSSLLNVIRKSLKNIESYHARHPYWTDRIRSAHLPLCHSTALQARSHRLRRLLYHQTILLLFPCK